MMGVGWGLGARHRRHAFVTLLRTPPYGSSLDRVSALPPTAPLPSAAAPGGRATAVLAAAAAEPHPAARMLSASSLRARCRLVFTVPTGSARTSQISWYARPST